MFSEKNIIVTIGDRGALVALYHGTKTKHKILVKELNSASEKQLKEIFFKNKSASVHIMLDTTDQSYKRKAYPSVKKGDLKQIIKRDMALDKNKNNIGNFIIFDNKKSLNGNNKRRECLFVSASISDSIGKWIAFILEMPNRTSGIYMLPVESFAMFQLLKNSVNLKFNHGTKRNDIYCLITQTKVGGLRQTIFSNEGIIFTRTLSYNIDDEGAMEKYEHDIYSAFEYLKRLLPDLRILEFDIINILPKKNLDEIEKINNVELNLINFTPSKAALESGYNTLITPGSNYCDLLISRVFASSNNKILKFTTAKILFFEKLFSILKATHYFNALLILAFCGLILFNSFSRGESYEQVEAAKIVKLASVQNLSKVKKTAPEGSQVIKGKGSASIDRIVDIGENNNLFAPITQKFGNISSDLEFIRDSKITLDRITYTLPNFDEKTLARGKYALSFSGKLVNESGDIEDLFKIFDTLVAKAEKDISDKKIRHNELPRNIDFNKRYYSMPVNFTITSIN
jgi:hypothetical protein